MGPQELASVLNRGFSLLLGLLLVQFVLRLAVNKNLTTDEMISCDVVEYSETIWKSLRRNYSKSTSNSFRNRFKMNEFKNRFHGGNDEFAKNLVCGDVGAFCFIGASGGGVKL